jgi:hypothetical protein
VWGLKNGIVPLDVLVNGPAFLYVQIYHLTHTPLLKMMVYLFYLKLVLWFVTKPLVDDVGEMTNVMETTRLDFFMEI